MDNDEDDGFDGVCDVAGWLKLKTHAGKKI